jgi:Fe-Mn family superoxide dismutase
MDNMNLDAIAPPMALALCASFGSVERWRDAFAARCAASRAAALSFLPRDGRLVTHALGEAPPGASPLLVLREGAAIDWAEVYARYQNAVHAASEALAADAQALDGALLIDVRRAGVFDSASAVIPGATWRDPAAVGDWAAQLPPDRDIVVYCVYGHEVGRATALRLRAQGLRVRYLRGGIDGWQAAGRPLQTKG